LKYQLEVNTIKNEKFERMDNTENKEDKNMMHEMMDEKKVDSF